MRAWVIGFAAIVLAGCLLNHERETRPGKVYRIDCRDDRTEPAWKDAVADTNITCDSAW